MTRRVEGQISRIYVSTTIGKTSDTDFADEGRHTITLVTTSIDDATFCDQIEIVTDRTQPGVEILQPTPETL